MSSVVVSSKYQVVIPKEVRERHGFKPGDKVVWFESGSGLKLIKPMTWEESAGCLAHLETEPFVREKDHDGGEFT
ncbi:MAG: AbrB/MazE/SpoVT family DNA-binding domain-containing protein [Thermoleophilia bacterium]|nr:AbrB/MazE/SpoVT family DNA-binding domain-containing protein [Thermoleophilia bacterium]